MTTHNKDVVLRLLGADQAKNAMRRSALRYASRVLLDLGYSGAALALDLEVSRRFGGGLARGTLTDFGDDTQVCDVGGRW